MAILQSYVIPRQALKNDDVQELPVQGLSCTTQANSSEHLVEDNGWTRTWDQAPVHGMIAGQLRRMPPTSPLAVLLGAYGSGMSYSNMNTARAQELSGQLFGPVYGPYSLYSSPLQAYPIGALHLLLGEW